MINKKFIGTEEVTISFEANDLNILCNTGRYSVAHEFEDYLELNCVPEIKLLRKTFGEDAKVILAYVIGLCEDNCSEKDKTNTVPYGDLNVTVRVTNKGAFIHWSKEIK